MYPTQITTLLFSTNIIHAYYKQNTPLFLGMMPLYTTSAIYHFIKHFYPLDIRTGIPLCQLDYCFCVLFYFAGLYDYFTRRTLKPPYSYFCQGMHVAMPMVFITAMRFNSLMWSNDIIVSEKWHALFHLLINFDTHVYLYCT
jgi:hypothetical protein